MKCGEGCPPPTVEKSGQGAVPSPESFSNFWFKMGHFWFKIFLAFRQKGKGLRPVPSLPQIRQCFGISGAGFLQAACPLKVEQR